MQIQAAMPRAVMWRIDYSKDRRQSVCARASFNRVCVCLNERRKGTVVVHRCHNKSFIQLVFLVALTVRH